MNAGSPGLGGRLHHIRGAIERAATRAGRDPAQVRLVAVSKGVDAARVAEAVALGVADLGENRVQEAEAKAPKVGRHAARWHLIGALQRNKAARAAYLFDRIHSVDRLELAQALSRHLTEAGRVMPVLVEVNVAGEASKHGVSAEELAALLEAVAAMPGLALDGLMTVGPRVERPEDARPVFAGLRRLRDRCASALGLALPELSMGMSGDFEVAVEEGSTLVRIGTALFGER